MGGGVKLLCCDNALLNKWGHTILCFLKNRFSNAMHAHVLILKTTSYEHMHFLKNLLSILFFDKNASRAYVDFFALSVHCLVLYGYITTYVIKYNAT